MFLRNLSSNELRQKFLNFFENKGHKVLPPFSLVPENDPTVLFTTAGMHPLVPYILGEIHPEGKRLCSVQPCARTDDIDEVGDERHLTFFEMLGNWSLGDYWKKDAIRWSYEFLTEELGLEHEKLAVTCFAGDNDAPKDTESAEIWKSLKIKEERIVYLGKKDNWWGPAGECGPCGPDTEIFYWSAKSPVPEKFDPNDKRWIEIWNNVFMEYEKRLKLSAERSEDKDEKSEVENQGFEYVPLKQKNVDTGLGFERTLAILQDKEDMFTTELFWPIIQKIEEISNKKYEQKKNEFRIIADHLRASVFILAEGILPSNKLQGYILRRLIRRSVAKGLMIGIEKKFTGDVAAVVIEIMKEAYPKVDKQKNQILAEIEKEEEKFRKNLKTIKWDYEEIDGKILFDLFQTYGVPVEVALEEAKIKNIKIKDSANKEFEILREKHRQLSRTASAGMFKGGLADNKVETTRLHTAAHLLLAALRQVLGPQVQQKGSNITGERLRFDFNNPEKLTSEQISKIENLVNEKIKENLPVVMEEMDLEEAKKSGATGVFDDRYGDRVKVYTIGSEDEVFSREICGGPHVKNTGELGHFKIVKEESSSSGVRRIKAILE